MMDGEYQHVTLRRPTRSSTRASQPAAAGPGEVGDVEAKDDQSMATVGTVLLEIKTYINMSSEQVLVRYHRLTRLARLAASDHAAGNPCYPFAV